LRARDYTCLRQAGDAPLAGWNFVERGGTLMVGQENEKTYLINGREVDAAILRG